MGSLFCSFLCAGCLMGGADESSGSFLYEPSYCMDEALRGAAEPYVPQPGDIVLSTDRLLFWKITFALALTGHPHHSGIVFRRPDGTLAVLEAGPHDGFWIEMMDCQPHLCSYEPEGPVWIRRRKTPLTQAQSAALTDFALRQEGKRFALVRLGGQMTLLRSRGPLRTRWLGGSHPDRRTYFCCELLMEACLAAGLLDPRSTRPAATYPRDVFFDRSLNPYLNKHLDMSCGWHPPQRWVSKPCRGAEPGRAQE